MDPAFELGRQHQEHNHQRQRKGNQNGRGGFFQFFGHPLIADARFQRQDFLRFLFHIVHGRGQIVAFCQVGRQGNRGQAIHPAQLRGIAGGGQFHHTGERYQIAVTAAQVDRQYVLGTAAGAFFGFQQHIIFATTIHVGGRGEGGEHGLQGLPHIGGGDAQIRGPFTIQFHVQLRLGLFEIGVDAGQVGIVIHGLHQGFAPGQHLLIVWSGDHHFQFLIEGTLPEPRGIHREGSQACHVHQRATNPVNDFLLGALAIFPVFQANNGERPLCHPPETNDCQHPLCFTVFHQRHENLFHGLGVMSAIFHRGSLGRGGWNNKDAAIFCGGEFLGQLTEQHHRHYTQQHAATNQQPR